MKILIVACHYAVASGRYALRAFRRLGHDVYSIGPAMGDAIWGLRVDPRWVWEPDGDRYAAWPNWTPDLIVLMDSAFPYHHPVYSNVPHVVWGVDGHVRNYEQPGIGHYFLAHSQGPCHPVGAPNTSHLACAYDPQAHTDLGLAREIDVAMVGVAYPARVALVQAISAADLNVWGETGLLWDDYRAAYNQAKISLVKSINGDLAQRFFETAAMGCCVLMDACPDAAKLGFIAGHHYWQYADAEDAVAQARMLLETGLWRTIAANGRAAVRDHSWDDRCLQVLETMGFIHYDESEEP